MINAKRVPDLSMGVGLVALLMVLGVSGAAPEPDAQGSRGTQTPTFEVDPLWPKPLPNHWVLGSVTGVAVDSQDHIFYCFSLIYPQSISKAGDLPVHIRGAVGVVLVEHEMPDPGPRQDNRNDATNSAAANDYDPGIANTFLFCR